MEENILEIIESNVSVGDNGIEISQSATAREIVAHVMEFTDWVRFEYIRGLQYPYILKNEDLYQYWRTNIKK